MLEKPFEDAEQVQEVKIHWLELAMVDGVDGM